MTAPDPLIGVTLDNRFHIESCLGDGGMGIIYQARHVLLHRLVAIKVLREAHDEISRRRFLQEARTASCLNHPNVVDILDYGTLEDNRPYLVMELLGGETLGRALIEGPMNVLRACRIAAQIAHGLQAVHEKGIVHRDLKPDNVFLVRSEQEEDDAGRERVKIFDFGIAKVLSGPRLTQVGLGPLRLQPAIECGSLLPTEQFTRTGSVLGTPEYMSPEQALGLEIDHRADQYALGCILYEMLSGALPFNDSDAEVILRKHATEPLIPLRERRPDLAIPEELDAIVSKALEKKRSERFSCMRELEQSLQLQIERLDRQERLSQAPDPKSQDPVPDYTRTSVIPRPLSLRRPLVRGSLLLATTLTAAGLVLWLRADRTQQAARPQSQRTSPGQAALAASTRPSIPAERSHVASSSPPTTPARHLTVRFTVPPRFTDGVKISCAVGPSKASASSQPPSMSSGPPPSLSAPRTTPLLNLERRCKGRCDIDLPAGEVHCVASSPGYLRAHINRDLVQDAALHNENITLKACLMMPDEDCEPASRQ